MFRLRWIGPGDVMDLVRFVSHDLGLDPKKELRSMAKSIQDYAYLSLVYSNKIVGYLIYKWQGPKVTIVRLTVLDKFRRMGGATQLLEPMLEAYSGSNAKPIVVKVGEDNLAAQKLFSKLGFKGTLYKDTSDYLFTFYSRASRKVVTDEVNQSQP